MNIQQGSDISVAVHTMVGMTHPVGPQDSDIETVLLARDQREGSVKTGLAFEIISAAARHKAVTPAP